MNKDYDVYVLLTTVLFAVFCLCFAINHFFSFKAQVKTANLQGAKIAYFTRGKGYPLILLPGFGMTMQHWDPLLLRRLSVHNEVVAYDYRGVGASTGQVNNSTQEMATDVIHLMDTLKIKKANIMGWSLGSFVAEEIAEHYPTRVNRLVLISTALGGDQQIEGSKEVSIAIQENLGGSWEDTYVSYFFVNLQARNNYLQRLKSAQNRGELLSGPGESTQAKIAQEQALSNTKIENSRTLYLPSIKSPTLLIAGKEDKVLPAENSIKTAKLIPNSKLIVLQQAGHAVLFEKANDVARLINTFLEQK